ARAARSILRLRRPELDGADDDRRDDNRHGGKLRNAATHGAWSGFGLGIYRERGAGPRGSQLVEDGRRRRVAAIAVLLQEAMDDRSHRGARELRHLRRTGGGLVEDGGGAGQNRIALERVDSGHGFEEQRPERKKIASR